MILALALFTLIVLGSGLTALEIARYRFNKNRKPIVFVKLLPVRGLMLKIAYSSELFPGWKVRQVSVASILTANGTGLDLIRDVFKYEKDFRNVQILNLGYRSKFTKFKDRVVGLKYPVITENMLVLLDSLSTGRSGDIYNITEEPISDAALLEKLEELKNTLEVSNG